MRTQNLGYTSKTFDELKSFYSQNRSEWTHRMYNVLTHNCNNFTDAVSKFALGTGIPEEIVTLPQRVMATPLGKMIMPQLTQMEQSLNDQGHNYFGEDPQGLRQNNNNNQQPNVIVPKTDPIEQSEE